ncbi:MAG: YceI family protein [Gallionellaceae bacterium]|nr:YceI family protein [Gallionellaceae bacterium]
MKLNTINVLCIFTSLLSGQASALEFKQVQANESSVSFGYTQMGVPMEGKFNKFSAQVTFEPAKLANAQARIDIDLASIDAGSVEANDEVAGKLWFNAKAYPTANFVSSGVKALSANRYEVSGKLSIKGATRDVIAPVTFQSSGTRGTFDGVFTIKRLDYKIGEGAWADLGTVANEIQIKFHVVVNAVPTKK